MSRPLRADPLDAFNHVFGRGLNSRPIFENDDDIRVFLSLLARAVREEWIEIHQFSILTTHYHLLVRSRTGQLSRAMHWILKMYAEWVNRTRGRRGYVFERRFGSKVIRSTRYWLVVVIYIDHNPVDARLVQAPEDYPFGSASRYAQPRGPIWLERSYLESFVCGQAGLGAYDPAAYRRVFRAKPTPGLRHVLRAGFERPTQEIGPFEELLRAAPSHVQEWLAEKARRTDGAPAGLVLLDPRTVRDVIAQHRREVPDARACAGSRRVEAYPLLEAGLLGTVAGLPLSGVAQRVGLSNGGAHRRVQAHLRALSGDPEYRELAAAIVQAGLERDYAPLLALPGALPVQLPASANDWTRPDRSH